MLCPREKPRESSKLTVLSFELELFVCTSHDLVAFWIGRLGLDGRTGGWLTCLPDLLLILQSRRPSPLPAVVAGLKPTHEGGKSATTLVLPPVYRSSACNNDA